MDEEILAVVQASAARRWMAVIMLAGLGLLVIYVAFATPPSLGWQVFLIGVGALALWLTERLRRATEHRIELTQTQLRDSSGVVIAEVADILSLDRGVFAFKPSNGFIVRTSSSPGRAWRPGMWWRMGRRVGIGGVTPGSQAKPMSEILSAMIAMRDMPTDPDTGFGAGPKDAGPKETAAKPDGD